MKKHSDHIKRNSLPAAHQPKSGMNKEITEIHPGALPGSIMSINVEGSRDAFSSKISSRNLPASIDHDLIGSSEATMMSSIQNSPFRGPALRSVEEDLRTTSRSTINANVFRIRPSTVHSRLNKLQTQESNNQSLSFTSPKSSYGKLKLKKSGSKSNENNSNTPRRGSRGKKASGGDETAHKGVKLLTSNALSKTKYGKPVEGQEGQAHAHRAIPPEPANINKPVSRHTSLKDHGFSAGNHNHEHDLSHKETVVMHGQHSHHGSIGKKKRKPKLNRIEEEKMLQKATNYRQVIYLEKNTHFDADEIRALQEMFKIYSNSTKKGMLDRLLFRDILIKTFGILDDEMLNRIYLFFDSDVEGSISDTEWVQNLSLFLRGTLDQHIDFVYGIYDINGDHSISREELTTLLQGCLFNVPGNDEDPNDGFREIVELALKSLDIDKTGVITPECFRKAVHRDPLLLQSLGPCLPAENNLKTFMALFSDNYHNYSTNYSNPRDPGYNFRSRIMPNTSRSHHGH